MSFLLQLSRRLAAALAAFAFATPALADVPQQARPALWEVSDSDTRIYMFGTIHLLPENVQWHSKALDSAISNSGELVVETVIDEKNPAPMLQAMAKLALSPGLPPVLDRVGKAKRAALKAAIEKSGLPAEAFDRMETWAVGFMLLGQQFKAIDLDKGEGVELVLRRSFLNSGKRVGELESNEEQLGFFDRLSEDSQREFLESVLEGDAPFKEQFAGMLQAWMRGDTEAIGKTFNEELSAMPELLDALVVQRNRKWSEWVARRMDQPGTVLLAVGAGHLAGPGSLIEMLGSSGLKVRRVQ